MNQSIASKRFLLAPLALVTAVATLTGCPDTSLSPGRPDGGGGGSDGGGGPAGRLTLVQTIVKADDAKVSGVQALVVSPDGKRVYVNSWISGDLGTYERDSADGSLTRRYSNGLAGGLQLSLTPDGKHLYSGGNSIQLLDVDPATGEPTLQSSDVTSAALEMTLAAGGSVLYVAQPEAIFSYLVDKTSGALTPGPVTPVASMIEYAIFADDAHHTLFASRDPDPTIYLVRFTVDATTGALAKEAETAAALGDPLAGLSMCSGTTRMYVPQSTPGNIGYADLTGEGISLTSSFSHPDLAHVSSVTVSPDCKNVYAVTLNGSSGSVVVLTRDEAGDLAWLSTIPTGPGTPLAAITHPLFVRVSPDGKSVYLASSAVGEGVAVFQRAP